jgi:hypothetical protein
MITIDSDGIEILKQETIERLEEIYRERERTRERRGFDKRITELEVQTEKVEIP